MVHQKRLSAPQHYPVERKDQAYVITGRGPHAEQSGLPLGVLLRDVLEYADNVSEVKEILNARNITVNGNVETDHHRTVGFMDVISIEKLDKDFRVALNNQGLVFQEVNDGDRRLRRIEDKTTVTGGKTQLNLDGGENMLTDEDYSTKSSLVIDLETGDVEDVYELAEGNLAYISGGKHTCETATIQDVEIVRGSQSNKVVLEGEDGSFETTEDYVYVIGNDDPEVEL